MLKTSDFEDYSTDIVLHSHKCSTGYKKLKINIESNGEELILMYKVTQTFTEHPSKTRESVMHHLATAIDKFNSIN